MSDVAHGSIVLEEMDILLKGCTERHVLENNFLQVQRKGENLPIVREHLTFKVLTEWCITEYMFLRVYQSDLYSSGGLKAVMYTDTFQTVIMTLGSFALVGISKSTLQWIFIFKNGVKFGYSWCRDWLSFDHCYSIL